MNTHSASEQDTRKPTEAYLHALFDAGRHGDAREESFYGPLAYEAIEACTLALPKACWIPL
jgi:hypothetical protein